VTVVDRDAVVKGAVLAILICLPLAIVAAVLTEPGDGSNWAPVLLLGTAAGLVAGGFVAARATSAGPYSNGALAALGAYVVIQGAAIVVRLIKGDDVHVAADVFNAVVAYGAGILGALVASRRASPA
jgi:hypothetical protein